MDRLLNLQVQVLVFGALAVLLLVLVLFRFRNKLGMAPLLVCLGVLQTVQVLFNSNPGIELLEGIRISRVSEIMQLGSLAVVVLVYLKTTIQSARKIITGLIFANLTITGLLLLYRWTLVPADSLSQAGSTLVFGSGASLRELIAGSASLILELPLLLFLFESGRRAAPRRLGLPILISLVGVQAVGALVSNGIAYLENPAFGAILSASLMIKLALGLLGGMVLIAYCNYLDPVFIQYRPVVDPPSAIFQALTKPQEFGSYDTGEKGAQERAGLSDSGYQLDGIALTNEEGEVVAWNQALENITGIPAEKALGQPIWEVEYQMRPEHLQTPEAFRLLKETMLDILETGQADWQAALQNRDYQHPEGRLITIQTTTFTLPTGKGYQICSVSRDITALISSLEELRISESRFKAIFDQAAVGVAQMDSRTGSFIQVNQRYCRILGYSEEELLEMKFKDITHPEDLSRDFSFQNRLIAGEVEDFTFEKRYIHKDGSQIWVSLTVSPMWAPGQEPDYHISVAQDITERKNIERALKESELRFRSLVEQSPTSTMLARPDGKLVYGNPASDTLWGLTPELSRQRLQNYNFLEDELSRKQGILPLIQRGFKGELIRIPPFLVDPGLYNPDYTGLKRWVQGYIYPVLDLDGSVMELVVVHEDISERKLAEDFLRQQARELDILNDIAREISTSLSLEHAVSSALNGVVEAVQPDLALLFLISNGKLILQDVSSNRIPALSHDRAIHKVGECLCGLAVLNQEPIFSLEISQDPRCTQDECKDARIQSFAAIPIQTGRAVIGVLGLGMKTTRDFSIQETFLLTLVDQISSGIQNANLYEELQDELGRREEVESALRVNEDRLSKIMIAANDGIWDWDLETDVVHYDARYYEMAGYEVDEFPHHLEEFQKRVHPDDLPAVMEEAQLHLTGELERFEVEFRFLRQDKSWMWIKGRGTIVEWNREHQPLRFIGTHTDITSRKEIEEELEQSREQLRQLANSLVQAIEDERTIIAREIHDEFGQRLTAMKMDLVRSAKLIPDDNPELADRIGRMGVLVDDTIDKVRRLSSQLRPGMLDDLGLPAALEWQTESFQNYAGIRCLLSLPDHSPPLESDLALSVFRIYQETLTNIARHAGATLVEILLKFGDDQLLLEVKDNGRGITSEEISQRESIGLVGMEERVRQFGGTLDIQGRSGQGTTVTVRVPLAGLSEETSS